MAKQILLVALVLLGAAAARADDAAWQRHLSAGSAASKAGDSATAIREFEAAAKAAAAFGERDPRRGATLNSLGFLYSAAGRHADAERAYLQAIAILEKAFWSTHPEVLNAMSNLAASYHRSRRAGEAEGLFRKVLAAREKALAPGDPALARTLNQLGLALHAQGKRGEAESIYKRSIAILEKTLGPEHQAVAYGLGPLATLYQRTGRYDEAERLRRRIVANLGKSLGEEHVELVDPLTELGDTFARQGREAEARAQLERALRIAERAYGPEDPRVASVLFSLATASSSGASADEHARRALRIREKAFGPDHPSTAAAMSVLAREYIVRGRDAEAEPLLRRAIAIEEKTLGPDSPSLATSLIGLSDVMRMRGSYEDAEALARRAVAIERKSSGAEDPRASYPLDRLAMIMRLQGRYGEAEETYREALRIRENALGVERVDVAILVNNLGELYAAQGRRAEAETLFRRAIAILESEVGPAHLALAGPLGNLAQSYLGQARYAEADPLFERSLRVLETLGPGARERRITLSNLAVSLSRQSRLKEARAVLEQSLALAAQAGQGEGPDSIEPLGNLAVVELREGRIEEARTLQGRALAIAEKTAGPEHPIVVPALHNLAGLAIAQKDYARGLEHSRRGAKVMAARIMATGGVASHGRLAEARELAYVFETQMLAAYLEAKRTPARTDALLAEAFDAAQFARTSDTADQVARMAARHAASTSRLGQAVRERQDLVERIRRLDADLVAAVSKPGPERNRQREDGMRASLAEAAAQLARLDDTIRAQFPEYAELTSQAPMPLGQARELLADDEALLSFVFLRHEQSGFLWIVRKSGGVLVPVDGSRVEVEDLVRRLREQLDPTTVDALQILAAPFNVALAHELYKKVFEPAEAHLQGIRHLLVVPDGALQGLPLGVLVTEPPRAPGAVIPGRAARAAAGEARNLQAAPAKPPALAPPAGATMPLAEVAWLLRKYAISTLPAVSSLRALRAFARPPVGTEPLRGFGDPILGAPEGAARKANVAALFSRGAVADVDEVRKLTRLPDTADELRAIAATLKADATQLFLGAQATEERVKQMDLAKARVVAFATHGLISGDFKGLAEPALVLTPPAKGTALDDGLLTASEVSQLKLNADLVILSACNSAAADGTPGADGLSGLARAFFHAGARSLLVSHWAVVSESTVALTTRLFEERAKGASKAQALRLSMLALMGRGDRPEFAHPLFWAPFVVVGEGGADR